MYWYRITKYNPEFRNEKGHYTKDEWTCPSQVGDIVEEKLFTWSDYIKVENTYVNAIMLFLECLNKKKLNVYRIIKNKKLVPDEHYTVDMRNLSNKIEPLFNNAKYNYVDTDLTLNENEIKSLVRLILRNELGAQLDSPELKVHFGWDYYMYIGSKELCEEIIPEIEKMGLFVEAIEDSPYNIE